MRRVDRLRGFGRILLFLLGLSLLVRFLLRLGGFLAVFFAGLVVFLAGFRGLRPSSTLAHSDQPPRMRRQSPEPALGSRAPYLYPPPSSARSGKTGAVAKISRSFFPRQTKASFCS